MRVCYLLAVITFLHGGVAAGATVVNGVEVDDATVPEEAGPGSEGPQRGIVAPPAGATVIDFDDTTQPSLFINTVALTTEYAAQGVTFSGPGGNDGGAILDEGGFFGVTGHSSPNFLAFNTGATLMNGGIPQGPETLTFGTAQQHVQINAGSSIGGTVTLECFAGATSAGSDSLISASALDTLQVSAPGITSCVLSFTGDVIVFDDLAFVPAPAPPILTIPTLSGAGFLVLVLLLLGAGLFVLRPRGPSSPTVP